MPPAATRSRHGRDRRGGPDRFRRTEEAQQAALELARSVRDAAAARRDAEWQAAEAANRRRLGLVLATPVLPAIAVALIGIAVHILLVVAAGLLVIAVALVAATWVGMTRAA